MISREVFPGPLLWPIAFLGLPMAFMALVGSAVLVWRKRKKRAAAMALSVPLILMLSWSLLEVACVFQVVVADISSPENAFRARTIMRDAGATTSWSVRVEVGTRGLVDWKWTPVFRTYRDVPAEISWRDRQTLVVRSHRSEYAQRLTARAGDVIVVFEECPAQEKASWQGPYVNGC